MPSDLETIVADPVEWCSSTFGDRLWSRQQEIMRACERYPRVAVKAGHGVGKTMSAARIALRRWLTPDGGILVTTAPTYRQVNDLLWREIRACDRVSRGTLAPCRPLQTPRWDADGTERWMAMGISTDNADMLQGYHDAGGVSAVIDEAAGVEDWVWGAILALQPKFILAIGNPTDPDSEFARCWDDPRWKTFSIPCDESPNLTGECEDIWGRQYPALCTPEWVEEVRDVPDPVSWTRNWLVERREPRRARPQAQRPPGAAPSDLATLGVAPASQARTGRGDAEGDEASGGSSHEM